MRRDELKTPEPMRGTLPNTDQPRIPTRSTCHNWRQGSERADLGIAGPPSGALLSPRKALVAMHRSAFVFTLVVILSSPTLSPIYDGLDVSVTYLISRGFTSTMTWFHVESINYNLRRTLHYNLACSAVFINCTYISCSLLCCLLVFSVVAVWSPALTAGYFVPHALFN